MSFCRRARSVGRDCDAHASRGSLPGFCCLKFDAYSSAAAQLGLVSLRALQCSPCCVLGSAGRPCHSTTTASWSCCSSCVVASRLLPSSDLPRNDGPSSAQGRLQPSVGARAGARAVSCLSGRVSVDELALPRRRCGCFASSPTPRRGSCLHAVFQRTLRQPRVPPP